MACVGRALLRVLLLPLALLSVACKEQPDVDSMPVHWILHSRAATEKPVQYLATKPNVYTETGFGLFLYRQLQPGIGVLEHSATIRELPPHIRYHWTFGNDDHWRFDDIHPYQLIPPDVIRRSRGWGYQPPPLLIRITFLPEGRLRFSWHACADASCRERGSPTLAFNAEHEFQGVRVAEPPPVRGQPRSNPSR